MEGRMEEMAKDIKEIKGRRDDSLIDSFTKEG